MPTNALPVDIVCLPRGWRVCQHQPRIKPVNTSVPITDFIQFAQSQPDYISQYYSKIKLEIPIFEIYNEMKASNKIIRATDEGAIQYKGSLGFATKTNYEIVL